MALQVANLKNLIISNLQTAGFDSGNDYAWLDQFALALATAIVTEIQANAQVTIPSGSSAGSYQVQ
jgi:hypothetical protein